MPARPSPLSKDRTYQINNVVSFGGSVPFVTFPPAWFRGDARRHRDSQGTADSCGIGALSRAGSHLAGLSADFQIVGAVCDFLRACVGVLYVDKCVQTRFPGYSVDFCRGIFSMFHRNASILQTFAMHGEGAFKKRLDPGIGLE